MVRQITVFLSASLLLIIGCRSPEFTSALMYVNENNHEKAEEFFNKALIIEPENALVPYFYARDVLLPAERWLEMAEMFERANTINPNTPLEKPIIIDGNIYSTVSEGSIACREQEWAKIFNKAVELYENKQNSDAIKLLNIAITVFADKANTYGTLASLYIESENLELAGKAATIGLEKDPDNLFILQVSADIAHKNKQLEQAVIFLEKALSISDEKGKILRKLIYLFIDIGDFETAIEYSKKAINEYPNDSDIFYNVGVLYQKMAIAIFEPARSRFVEESNKEKWDKEIMNLIYEDFKKARTFCVDAKDYFLDSSYLEGDESSSAHAVAEMKKTIKQLDDIFIPSVRDMME